jgi:hypothetical protein
LTIPRSSALEALLDAGVLLHQLRLLRGVLLRPRLHLPRQPRQLRLELVVLTLRLAKVGAQRLHFLT